MDNFKDRFEQIKFQVWQRYRKFIDDMGPYVWQRWTATGVLAFFYLLRVFSVHGYYLLTYALGIFSLNHLVLFLSPKIDPESDGTDALPLPLSNSIEDFRPFIRALPEKVFWQRMTLAIIVSFLCSFLPFLNIPAFWPILVVYFVGLTFATMKNQIAHMIKYKYLPWEYGKKRYNQPQEPKLFSD